MHDPPPPPPQVIKSLPHWRTHASDSPLLDHGRLFCPCLILMMKTALIWLLWTHRIWSDVRFLWMHKMMVSTFEHALLNASTNTNKAITQPTSTSSSGAQSMMMSTRRSFHIIYSWTSFRRTWRMMPLFENSGRLLDIKVL